MQTELVAAAIRSRLDFPGRAVCVNAWVRTQVCAQPRVCRARDMQGTLWAIPAILWTPEGKGCFSPVWHNSEHLGCIPRTKVIVNLVMDAVGKRKTECSGPVPFFGLWRLSASPVVLRVFPF